MASVADLVFLLLIFFMITSTLVSPNAVKLILPSGNSKTISKQSTTVYINDLNQIFVNETPANEQNLQQLLTRSLIGQTDGVVVLRADQTVAVQYIATVIDNVNQINKILKTRHKLILATKPIK
jgi:biopolymer transport protein ExbD